MKTRSFIFLQRAPGIYLQFPYMVSIKLVYFQKRVRVIYLSSSLSFVV